MHLKIKIEEKFKLKTKLTETKKLKMNSIQGMQNLFSFQTPFKFLKSTGSGDTTSGARDLFPLCFQRKTQKWGKDCLVMIDN